jgi:hypothetical protein
MKGERKLRHKLQLLWTDLKAGAAFDRAAIEPGAGVAENFPKPDSGTPRISNMAGDVDVIIMQLGTVQNCSGELLLFTHTSIAIIFTGSGFSIEISFI